MSSEYVKPEYSALCDVDANIYDKFLVAVREYNCLLAFGEGGRNLPQAAKRRDGSTGRGEVSSVVGGGGGGEHSVGSDFISCFVEEVFSQTSETGQVLNNVDIIDNASRFVDSSALGKKKRVKSKRVKRGAVNTVEVGKSEFVSDQDEQLRVVRFNTAKLKEEAERTRLLVHQQQLVCATNKVEDQLNQREKNNVKESAEDASFRKELEITWKKRRILENKQAIIKSQSFISSWDASWSAEAARKDENIETASYRQSLLGMKMRKLNAQIKSEKIKDAEAALSRYELSAASGPRDFSDMMSDPMGKARDARIQSIANTTSLESGVPSVPVVVLEEERQKFKNLQTKFTDLESQLKKKNQSFLSMKTERDVYKKTVEDIDKQSKRKADRFEQTRYPNVFAENY